MTGWFDLKLNVSKKYIIGNTPAGSEPLIVNEILEETKQPSIYIASNREKQERFLEASNFLCPYLKSEALPAWDCLPYDRLFPSPKIIGQRVKTLTNLANQLSRIDVLVVTAASVMQLVPPINYFQDKFLELNVGQKIERDFFIRQLVDYGYRNSPLVYEPGDFAIRGGIIDLFPSSEIDPVRIDFFGDSIEAIRYFDVRSQISSKSLGKVKIMSLMEFDFTNDSVSKFRSNYRRHFGGVKVNNQTYHSVSERHYLQGIEHFLPFFHEKLVPIFEYLEGALIFCDSGAKSHIKEHEKLIKKQFEIRQLDFGLGSEGKEKSNLVPIESMFLNFDALNSSLSETSVVTFDENPSPKGQFFLNSEIKYGRDFTLERTNKNSSVIEPLVAYINQVRSKKPIFLIFYSQKAAERFKLLLEEFGVTGIMFCECINIFESITNNIFIGICIIERGFSSNDFQIITERDIFGEKIIRKSKRSSSDIDKLRFASEINVNELVVHVDHGVGKYVGLEIISAANSRHECLVIEYHGNDRLLLPTANIELLSKYGSEFASLDRLGSASWQARKANMAKKINDIAKSLIKVAATRAINKAPILSVPDSGWHEFCSEFPFQETVDQERAVNDIISDFKKGSPSDRLICGDVGFGKTEIALRAAFLAVSNFKQVALIAPTTILCNQHFNNFLVRFRNTNVRIAQLSRLVSNKEAIKIKQNLAKGEVDIIIGTHAVLEESISFLNLSLVIIDEEQQFGVVDKEKLKKITSDVHILSLTATPIPRTLQQAFTGLREMSLIMTPPADRIAVQTYSINFDKVVIKEALLREKSRGGQSFYIVPRVSDIEEVKRFLSKTVPELTFVEAHGQMGISGLERNVEGFYLGKFDILLATTIAQSGLDIPSANTIIIHNADYFGLAQLYQLRGRVGRSKIRSYAYFLTSNERAISEVAKKRLSLVASLQDLGAGFALASQDLDMRGAGNLLGDEQSGHVREIGVELYQQMLKNRIEHLTSGGNLKNVPRDAWSPQINIGISSLIPDSYIGDLGIRLSIYQRLAAVEEFQSYSDIMDELHDRFGKPPTEVYALIELMKIKNLSKKAGIVKLDCSNNGASIVFLDDTFSEPDGLIKLIERNKNSLKVKKGKLVIVRKWSNLKLRLKELKYFLSKLVSLKEKNALQGGR